jgi:hypothetical protein
MVCYLMAHNLPYPLHNLFCGAAYCFDGFLKDAILSGSTSV